MIAAVFLIVVGVLLSLSPAVLAVRLIEGREPTNPNHSTIKVVRGYILLWAIGQFLIILATTYIRGL